jgi:hypothetical protein
MDVSKIDLANWKPDLDEASGLFESAIGGLGLWHEQDACFLRIYVQGFRRMNHG